MNVSQIYIGGGTCKNAWFCTSLPADEKKVYSKENNSAYQSTQTNNTWRPNMMGTEKMGICM